MANGSYPMTTGVGAVALNATSDDDPSFISSAVLAMQPQWEPIDVCLAGTRGLRANCRSLIPQEPSESDDAYKRRIFHSTLPPFLSRLASQAAGIILRRGVKIEGDEFWLQWAQNVTGDGTTIDEYARRQLITALLYGHSSTIVDFSAASTPRTLAEERQMARRPYLVPVHPRQVLGWRLRNDSASSELTQVRIREQVMLPAGAYGEDVVEQIRVLTPGGYELWRSEPLTALPTGFSLTTPRKWTLEESGTTSLNRIPLCTVYSQRTGNLTSTPPLGEIAHLAIAYAQRFADLHHGIHVGSNPMLVLRGFDPDSDTPLGISVNTALLLPPDGGAEFVSAPSEAYDSQLRCLQALEDQISRLGINTLTSQNLTNAAAEARRMDRIDSDSIMASISLDLERTLNQLFELAAEYVGVEPPQVLIPRDYDNRMLTGNDTTALLQLFMQNAISQQTLLKILQDGEILPPNVDIDAEIALTQEQAAEAMALNNLAANGGPAPGPSGPDMAFQNAGQGESLNSQTLPTPLRPGRNAD